MTRPKDTVAVFPGTFDPVTLGHLDVIRRAANLFSRVVVGVGHNPEKTEIFTTDDRVAMISELVAESRNVEVGSYDGLTMEFVRKMNASVIVRGIRDSADLRDELQFANANLIVGDIETVFLMTSEQHALTSSSLIKQIVELGGADTDRLRNLIPEGVLVRLRQKLAKEGGSA
jgi:pantetheine-phosphate adenylyltransferase